MKGFSAHTHMYPSLSESSPSPDLFIYLPKMEPITYPARNNTTARPSLDDVGRDLDDLDRDLDDLGRDLDQVQRGLRELLLDVQHLANLAQSAKGNTQGLRRLDGAAAAAKGNISSNPQPTCHDKGGRSPSLDCHAQNEAKYSVDARPNPELSGESAPDPSRRGGGQLYDPTARPLVPRSQRQAAISNAELKENIPNCNKKTNCTDPPIETNDEAPEARTPPLPAKYPSRLQLSETSQKENVPGRNNEGLLGAESTRTKFGSPANTEPPPENKERYSKEQVELAERVIRAAASGIGSHYNVLGLAMSATGADVGRSFRMLSRRLHPDKNRAPAAQEAFQALNTAHEVLKSSTKRADYDRSVLRQNVPCPAAGGGGVPRWTRARLPPLVQLRRDQPHSELSSLEFGTRVTVQRLTGGIEITRLNGMKGSVQGFNHETSKYIVSIDSDWLCGGFVELSPSSLFQNIEVGIRNAA